jgi:signal transduction histidine kinase
VQVDCNSGPTVRVRVRDRGAGISPEDQDRIFERSSGGQAETQSGMGLGLWIVREIVLAHPGRVRVESPPGGGATFGVSLPAGR